MKDEYIEEMIIDENLKCLPDDFDSLCEHQKFERKVQEETYQRLKERGELRTEDEPKYEPKGEPYVPKQRRRARNYNYKVGDFTYRDDGSLQRLKNFTYYDNYWEDYKYDKKIKNEEQFAEFLKENNPDQYKRAYTDEWCIDNCTDYAGYFGHKTDPDDWDEFHSV